MRLHERRGLTRAGRAVLCVLAAVVSTMSVRTAAIAASPTKNAGPTNGPPRLIVKLKATLAERAEATMSGVELSPSDAQGDPAVSAFFARHAARRMSPLYPALASMKKDAGLTDREIASAVRQRFPARGRRFRGTAPAPTLSRTYVVEVEGAVDQALAALRADPDVEYAEEDKVVSVGLTPNDPYFGSSGTWGQTYADLWGVKKIGAPAAWDTTAGQGVIVAVVDTGVDATHPDLTHNLWVNGAEIPGNGIDDDGNGFIDDTRGWDFVSSDNDPRDGHGHGTHVSGTIAAEGNNGVGVIGVAYRATIMPVRGLDNSGNGLDSWLANAITYAANNGADIINASWGGPGSSQTIADAVTYAHSVGVAVVVSAGNDSADARNYYPASLANVITVAATAPDDTLAYFSNFGNKIDVSAPGQDILSCAGAGTAMGTTVAPGYTRASGTSMAAPHVAGLAALILAQHPTYSNEEVRQVLRVSAADLGTPGVDPSHGYGRVNAAAAMGVAGVLEAKIFAPKDGTRLGASTTSFTGVARGAGFLRYVLAYGAGPSPTVWTTIQDSLFPATGGSIGAIDPVALADGLYTVRLTAYDMTGHAFADQIQVDVDNLSITSPPPATVPSTAAVFKPGVSIPVTGTALALAFQSFRLEWAPGINATSGWSTQGVTLTGGGTSPVMNGPLGTWATPLVSQADYYTLRLTVQGSSSTSETRALVYLEPDLLTANWPKWLDQGPNSRSGAVPAVDELGNVRLQVVNPSYLTTPNPSRLWTFLPDGSTPTTSGLFYGSYANPAAGNVDGIPGDETVVAEAWSMRVFRKDGTSYSLSPGSLTVNFQRAVVLIDDLDGDGANEVIAVGSDLNTKKAYVFAWRANGDQVGPNFPLQIEDQHDQLQAWSREPRVFVANLDGSGGKELLVTEGVSPSSYRVRLFGADGSPRVSMPVINGATVHQVALADFEGDGRLEVVVIGLDGTENFVHVFEPDGTERPGWPVRVLYPGTATMAIADLDRDGRSEVIVLNWEVLYVLKADGSSFSSAWPRSEPTNNPLSGLTVADVDGDGYPDILVTQKLTPPSPGGTGVAAAPLREADAATLPETEAATAQQVGPDAEVRSRVMEDGSVATGTFVTPAASADVATYNEPKLLVIRRDGVVTRSWRLMGAQGDQPYYQSTLTVGDFNRDGSTDIAVSYQTIDGGGQGGWLTEGILTILNTGASRTVSSDWPMVYHDGRNTSRLGSAASAGPPVIQITSPSNGAIVSGVVGLSVTVSNDQPILGVQYLLDGFQLGPEVTAFPYATTFDSTPFSVGSHALTAIMRDALGRFTPSPIVNVTVADTTPPMANLFSPLPGATVGGQVTVTVGAIDDHGVISFLELYVDGSLRATSPGGSFPSFNLLWDATLDVDGPHTLHARAYDPSGNFGLTNPVSVTVFNGLAAFDPVRRVPVCSLVGAICDSGTLLNGRAGLGPEPNQPNTINLSCADGTSGTYHLDPSNDAIRIVSQDGRPLRYGATARIEAKVWARTPSSERLDLYYSSTVNPPSWTFLRTLTPTGSAGSRVLTTTYTLPFGGMQAVRARYRSLGTATPCSPGTVNDHDDIVFAVKPNVAPTAKANGPYQGKTGDVITFSSAGSSDPDGDPLTYQWSFGDGTTSTLANPTHVYSSGFNYTAQLVVRDGAYSSTVSSAPVTITWPPTLELFIQGHNGGSGIVTIAPSGATCANIPGGSQLCNYTYPETTTLTLTAAPAADSTFAGWAGDCSGTGTCQISVNSLFSVQATFDGPPPPNGVLDVVVSGTQGGQGSVLITPPSTTCANLPGATQMCSTSPALNSVVNLVAMPGPDSIFTGWTGACTGTGMCDVPISEYQQVTATFRGPQILDVFVTGEQGGTGVVRITPPDAMCANPPGGPLGSGQLCSTTHRVGTMVILDPTPSPDSVFVGWTGACTGTGACTVTMEDYRQVTAKFRGPQVLDVFVTGEQGGTGVVRITPPNALCANPPGGPLGSGQLCSTTHRVGTMVILDPTPSPDSVFVGWTGACTGTGACTVTMDDYRQVTATFRGPQVLDVTVTGVEGGYGGVNIAPPGAVCTSVPGIAQTCTSLHAPGTVVTLDALPGAESVFVGWSGACTNLTGPCLVAMDAAHSVTAKFRGPQALTVTLTATLGGSGAVQVDPPGQACTLVGEAASQCAYLERVGTVVTLTALPASDTLFLEWGGACSGAGACIVSVAEATAVTAKFRLANRAPVAIAGGPYTAPRGVAVELDGRGSSDPDGDALAYRWDFGDGSTGTGPMPTHTYAALGPYVATLIVNDGALDSAPATTTVTIANRPPVADIGGPYAAHHGAAVNFDASHSADADGDTLTFVWAFGDGSTGEGAARSHVYVADGDYPVTLEVSDGTDTVTASTTVHITNDVPLASAGGPYSGFKNVAFALDGSGSSDGNGDALTYRWDFGDGTTGSGAHPSHLYAIPAGSASHVYTATLVVSDGITDSAPATAAVEVLDHAPHADATGASTGFRNQPVAFDASGSTDEDGDALAYRWDFGDGGTSTERAPTHAYAAFGGYTARLVVSDGHLDSAPAFVAITILDRAPVASAGGPYTAVRGAAITLDGAGSSDPDGNALTYAWDFGDGSAPGSGVTPVHSYAGVGTFAVRLVVSDGSTSSAPAFATVTITNRGPVASPGGPYSGVRGASVAFSGAGSSDPDGDPLTYRWTFGDGGTSTLAAPTHAYATLGTFMVTLVVNDGRADSVPATTTVTITNRAPTARPGGPYAGLRGVAVAFDAGTSTDPDNDPLTYSWTFGDGATATGRTPTHAYATLGTFTVTLVVNDGFTSSAPATTTVIVSNRPPVANAGTDRTVVRRTSVTLDGRASSDPDGTISAYAWRQLSGPTVSITNANTSQPRFTAPNVSSTTTLTFELKVTDNNGATATDQIVVTVTR